jgi:hypothetical protein
LIKKKKWNENEREWRYIPHLNPNKDFHLSLHLRWQWLAYWTDMLEKFGWKDWCHTFNYDGIDISSKSFIYIIMFNNYHHFQPHELWQWKMYNIQKLSSCMICRQIFDTIKRNLNCKISYFLSIIMRFWLQASSLELCNAIPPLDPLSRPFYFCFIPTLAQLVAPLLRHWVHLPLLCNACLICFLIDNLLDFSGHFKLCSNVYKLLEFITIV